VGSQRAGWGLAVNLLPVVWGGAYRGGSPKRVLAGGRNLDLKKENMSTKIQGRIAVKRLTNAAKDGKVGGMHLSAGCQAKAYLGEGGD